MTMKTYKLLLLGLGALWFTSCEKELDRDLTDVSVSVATNENVRYEGNILTVKKGTPIEFLLHGDPDYVTNIFIVTVKRLMWMILNPVF